MKRLKRAFIAAIALVGLTLIGTSNVSAQPFGLGGQQGLDIPQHKLLSGGGRFVFGQVSASSKDKFMLDTVSGRLWRISESGGVGLFLKAVPYRIGDGEYEPLPPEQPKGEAEETKKE